ncbi:hypothetical protein A3C21_00020 [Candidatus Kaiserbacteria bacterium RIFCSPHIGHO2_02_FULL_59_21]|uniref:Thioredoxin domain-containing protein n=1 Tax=Candidatus Kaiserbacteria bacterium RIFCSPHIGHO2_02_FULL_59_21 TaxID=1798500 RepID=A0A1F6E196_9BACT|nr:MAG: hypothetical protein A2766_00855 [Candidatus Kaiserbacteria bacterium RIFCSPHIGHO2_01_FULL_58_22]OGG67475.1 MAG: hypothetical protein A3C21_00020 [Candidatus Kaiserbacteria bacterium RIFCSPHIGHO2_02_FULL_59_21]OGG80114.1 MAG: hypothetical protein A2952_03445 [Candidatus Kaiserbacteria bacterium RIFCSPLOWO2_01_FULL_59_34]OGG86905.1 MAG: hypothetical protein A3I47_02835 [Candidatus Kaiserbacteria bacterium RIFCSPLOWO2_02_FULL_59_19]
MPPTAQTPRDYSTLFIPASIVIAALIVAAGLYLGLSQSGGLGVADSAQPVAVDIKDVKTEGDPYIGKADAKVVLAYWSDYQCPYCKAVEMGHPQIPIQPALPVLIRDYVDTGKLKIVFKDYQFLSDDSTTAGLYGRAVWALYPAKYFEWREAMYKSQDEEHGGFGDEASILVLIKKISGMDADKVKADVAANKAGYQKKLNADRAEGTSFGINGTPGFITGKVLIPGAAELASFKAAIDPQL